MRGAAPAPKPQLRVPGVAHLGCYRGDTGARYRPHLDNDPSEHDSSRRELTILLYTNVGWDAERHGGCLRLHPSAVQAEAAA